MSTLNGVAVFNVFWAILQRDLLRFLQQRARFFAALVRPLLWLFVFAIGFRGAFDLGVLEPYGTAVSYDTYILPGLIGMIQLFNGMQNSLSMVYDREMGSMKLLMTAPWPRWFLLGCRLVSGTIVSLFQVYAFLLIATLFGFDIPLLGTLAAAPVLVVTGLMLGALGMVLASRIEQLENFAGVMNFVIFPMFFASSALYPLRQLEASSQILHTVALANPLTWAVELIRHSLYFSSNIPALITIAGFAVVFCTLAVAGYAPKTGRSPGNRAK